MEAARNAGYESESMERILSLMASDLSSSRMISAILSSELGMTVR